MLNVLNTLNVYKCIYNLWPYENPRHFHSIALLLIHSMIYLTGNTAYSYSLTLGPISQGVGGAGLASTEVSESAFLNPASLAHAPIFSSSLYYFTGHSEMNSEETTLGFSMADNHPGVLAPGAVRYAQSRKIIDGFSEIKEKVWQVSLGHFIYNQWALGASVYRLQQEEVKGARQSYRQWNGILGLHWNPHSALGLGLVYHHLNEPSTKIPPHLRLIPNWGVGAVYITSPFLKVKFDITLPKKNNPDDQISYHGGVESAISKYITFRAGGKIDKITQNNSYTAGATFNFPRWHLNYSFTKHDTRADASRKIMHGIDLGTSF